MYPRPNNERYVTKTPNHWSLGNNNQNRRIQPQDQDQQQKSVTKSQKSLESLLSSPHLRQTQISHSPASNRPTFYQFQKQQNAQRTIWDNNLSYGSSYSKPYPTNIQQIEANNQQTFFKADSYLANNNQLINKQNLDRKPSDMTGVGNQSEDKPDFQVQVEEGSFHVKKESPKADSSLAIAMQQVQSSSLAPEEKKTRQIEQMQRECSSDDATSSSEDEELEKSSPLNTSSLSAKVPTTNQSAHHSLVKRTLFHLHTLSNLWSKSSQEEKERKRRIKRKEKEAKKSAQQKQTPENFDRQVSENDRLENIMQRVTLYSAFAIVCLLIFLVVGKIVAQSDADSKRSQLQHTQQVIQPVPKLDLTKYEHLRQVKNPVTPTTSERLEDSVKNSRLRDSNKRLLTAGSSSSSTNTFTTSSTSASSRISLMDKFRQGLDSWIVPRGPGFGFTSDKRRTSTTPKPDGREQEWSEDIAQEEPKPKKKPRYHAPSESGALSEGQPEVAPKEDAQKVSNPCANCVKESYLAHYYHKGCKPVRSRECDCVKFFRCPRKPPQPTLNKEDSIKASVEKDRTCVYNGKVYGLNERIPNPDEPCRMCRCRKRQFFNGTIVKTYGEVDCSLFVECPEMVFGVKPKRDQCHFAYRHDQCCGTEVCTDELPKEDLRVRTTCAYKNKVYKFGEMIYPDENSCMKCICDEGWNEHDPANSKGCKPRQCSAFLQANILQKCTPIYRIDGCCPIDFMCPEKRKLYDREEEEQELNKENEDKLDDSLDFGSSQTQSSQTVPNKCTHDGTSYLLGTKIYVERQDTQHGRTCARCECKVPPLLTCQADFKCTGQ